MTQNSRLTDYTYSAEWAAEQDRQDPLGSFRDRFIFPKVDGKEAIYFCGNSLGLQPKSTREYLNRELKKWAEFAVDGHFYAEEPWYTYHKHLTKPLANLVGAQENEVVAMNNLSTNLHLMFVSFYRPTATRNKIIMEAGAFPSDMYALESQAKHHGFNPDEVIIEVKPRRGEQLIRHEDILAAIEEAGDSLAMVIFGGLQYYTGQVFNMEDITAAAHKVGAYCGFDLAHAIGNVPLKLHQWNVDFAVWCTYKYLNSGPGSVGGAYVHQKHGLDPNFPRFAGWWGYNEEKRFQMTKGFDPVPGAEGWMLANSNILPLAAQRASLDMFEEAGFARLREKSLKLTGYLEWILCEAIGCHDMGLDIISPSNPEERGCQLSLYVNRGGKQVFEQISLAGVIGDWREPNVIRIAPTPMYNSFTDVYRFGQILEHALESVNQITE
jgi:kynureninase